MSPRQASEILLPDTDLDVLSDIKVPDTSAVNDLITVVDPGGGNPLRFETVPRSALSGDYIPYSEKGAPLGVATLDASGKLPVSQVPLIAINEVFNAASEAAMLALTAQTGDMARRTDLSNKLYVLAGTGDPTILSNWIEVAAGVVSGGGTRTSTTLLTGSIAGNGQATGSLALAKGTEIWSVREVNRRMCRVRLYGRSGARNADTARDADVSAISGMYPAGTGLALDVELASDTEYAMEMDPKAVAGSPLDPPVVTVYWTVDNYTSDAIVFEIELRHTPLES